MPMFHRLQAARLLAVLGLAGLTGAAMTAEADAQTHCVTYVCGHGGPPVAHPAPLPPPAAGRDAADMSEEGAAWQAGYAAGSRETASSSYQTTTTRRETRSTHVRRTRPAASSGQRARSHSQRSTSARSTTRRSASAHPQRRTRSTAATQTRRHVSARHHYTTSTVTTHDYNPVVDRASIYQAAAVGQSTVISSWSGRGESWQSGSVTVTRWVGPSQTGWTMAPMPGGGMSQQMCGWGYRVDQLPGAGPAQQPAFLCQCSAGWRPPGWTHD